MPSTPASPHSGVPTFRFAARSDTGQVRKNNQDSGYAGAHFLLIADGMGGHAGGDVASSLAIGRLTELDQPFALALIDGGLGRLGETVRSPQGDRLVDLTITSPVLVDPEGARRDG